MDVRLHKLARTTPAVRREIQVSQASVADLADRYGVSHATIRKWKSRKTSNDYSHKRHNLLSSLSQAEEALVIALKRDVGLSLNDITEVMNRCVNENLSRSAIYRCLKRNGVSGKQKSSQKKQAGAFETVTEPGFIHMDVKYLTVLDGKRSYVYVAIDRATRYVYAEVLYDLKPKTAAGFVTRFIDHFPCQTKTILTDNGMEWTDRCNHSVKNKATGNHAVDKVCKNHAIKHKLTKPRKPQTNGMVERFNRRINEAIARKQKVKDNQRKNSFSSHTQRNQFVLNFVQNYNMTRLQCIKYKTPKQLLYNQTELYTYAGMTTEDIIFEWSRTTF